MAELSGEAVGRWAPNTLKVLEQRLPLPEGNLDTGDATRIQSAVLHIAKYAAPGASGEVKGMPDYVSRLPQWEVPPPRLAQIRRTVGKIVLGSSVGSLPVWQVRELVPTERAAKSRTF